MVTEDSALLFPIGHCIGAYYDAPASTEHFFQVRVGPEVVRLRDDQFAVWGLAHGTPDRPEGQPWNRAAVLTAARQAGIAEAETVLGSLLEDKMLAETSPGTESALDFARRYRMLPLMLGLGNTTEEPRLYSVGLIGQPIVSMSGVAYDLYEWAHMDANLWLACQGAAESARSVGIQDEISTDPARMLDALLGTLHVLLSPNAIYLDTRLA